PENVDARAALLLLAPIYGRWAEVQSGCLRLLTHDPGNSILQYNLAHTLCETGQWRAAVPVLIEVAHREPFWPLLRQWLFHALLASRRIEEADDLLADALIRWPRRIQFWLEMHFNLLTSNRPAEAMSFAVDPSKRPLDSESMINLALIVGEAVVNGSNST